MQWNIWRWCPINFGFQIKYFFSELGGKWGEAAQNGVGVSSKQGSLDRLQLAGNYGNYLGSTSDAPSQVEGCSRFGPWSPAWWPWILNRRDSPASAGWEMKEKEGSTEERSFVWRCCPWPSIFPAQTPPDEKRAAVRTLLEPVATFTQSHHLFGFHRVDFKVQSTYQALHSGQWGREGTKREQRRGDRGGSLMKMMPEDVGGRR